MIFEKYVGGSEQSEAQKALFAMMDGVDVGVDYADMIRLRMDGRAVAECYDAYYLAREGETAFSRLWNGWGKHEDAIGNWGNFLTDEKMRGQGVGGGLLRFWYEDLEGEEKKPLCLCCTAANEGLVTVYGRYGFVRAVEGKMYLYKPLGDNPTTFKEFCETYYRPSETLVHKPACLGYRHEIDCLLRFAYADLGLTLGIGEQTGVERAILRYPHRAGMLFSEDGHCVGWSFDGQIQVHPLYAGTRIL